MKKLLASLSFLALVAFVGCETKSTPGGPGATNPSAKKPLVGQADNTFTLDVPNLATNVKQGESKTVGIALNRGNNFEEDVTLKFDNLPKGVTVEPSDPTIKKGEKEAKITLKAAADAAVGDFNVKVTGHPTKGADASNEFKVTVDKK